MTTAYDGPSSHWGSRFFARTLKDENKETERARKARDKRAARQKELLSRPVKPIHSAKDGWRGFLGRLAENINGLGR